MDVYFEPDPENGSQANYTNKNCRLAQSGIKPYRRCNYCTLATRQCLGLQNNIISVFIGLLLIGFVLMHDSMAVRINIVAVLVLLIFLGYRINQNLDKLAKADFHNLQLARKLQDHAEGLETIVDARTNELKRMAIVDALTGLLNRTEFEKQLEIAIRGAHYKDEQHVLCYMDLDRFKIVNDSCGHHAGDELLRQITPILLDNVRESDTVARLGGDEFGILFMHSDISTAKEIAQRILKAIEDYRFSWEDSTFSIGVSIGLIGISQETGSMVDLLTAADAACYRAKELGRNRIHIYELEQDEIQRRRSELQWIARITTALDEDRFRLHYQPIIDLTNPNTRSRHYEALIRKLGDDGTLIPPMSFLPAAERFNMMHRIDRWSIRQAIMDCKQLQQIGATYISVNLSGSSLTDEALYSYIKEQLYEHGVSPALLIFEITETAAITNLHKATQLIDSLRELGCRIALDDFGSGLASFGYLKNLPIDYLKIDGSFVKDMLTDKADRTMVEVLNYIGHAMNKMTIAEYVENREILERIRNMGIDYAQGYGIGEAVSLETLFEQQAARPA